MSATLEAVQDPNEEPGQLEFFDPKLYVQDLFSIGSTNKHSTDMELHPGQHVEFRGTGAVVGLLLEGFASDSAKPQRVYRIAADFVELI
jgi:hypothetical protein